VPLRERDTSTLDFLLLGWMFLFDKSQNYWAESGPVKISTILVIYTLKAILIQIIQTTYFI
jgi:hypothetical protein